MYLEKHRSKEVQNPETFETDHKSKIQGVIEVFFEVYEFVEDKKTKPRMLVWIACW